MGETFRAEFGFDAYTVARREMPEYFNWDNETQIWRVYVSTFDIRRTTKSIIAYSQYIGVARETWSATFVFTEHPFLSRITLHASHIEVRATTKQLQATAMFTISVYLGELGISYKDTEDDDFNFFLEDVVWISYYFRKFVRKLSLDNITNITVFDSFMDPITDFTKVPAAEPRFKRISPIKRYEVQSDAKKALLGLGGGIHYLPKDVIDVIAKADVRTLLTLGMSGNRYFYKMVSDPVVWQYLFQRDFPGEYAYFKGEIPPFAHSDLFLRANVDYVNPGTFDNDWKRFYLVFRWLYKKAGHDSGKVRVNDATFSDDFVMTFMDRFLFILVHTFLRIAKPDPDVNMYTEPVDLLILYTLDMTDVQMQVLFQLHHYETDDPLRIYRERRAEKRVPRYNPLVDDLLMAYGRRKLRISDFSFYKHRENWQKLLRYTDDDYGFFECVSNMFHYRTLGFLEHRTPIFLLYADTTALSTFLHGVAVHPDFGEPERPWLQMAYETLEANRQWFFSEPTQIQLGVLATYNDTAEYCGTLWILLQLFAVAPRVNRKLILEHLK